MLEIYKQNINDVIKQFNSNAENGLDEKAILSAREKYGNNVLKATNTRSVLKILLSVGQFLCE